jgi:hypothetical protein
MWGTNLRNWFEIFAGMTVSRVGDPSTEQGWLNWSDVERSFLLGGKTFNGQKYDPNNKAQRNDLLDGLIKYAGVLCEVKLLERRRQIDPPSLDYRVTRLGRRIDGWGYGPKPGFRKAAVFFAIEAFYRLKRFKGIIAVGAFGWAALNAARFYGYAAEWIDGTAFPVLSAFTIAAVLAAWHFVIRR